ncbi:hypothetical protein BDW69DRAFT_201865 [Aspergillus filifer]
MVPPAQHQQRPLKVANNVKQPYNHGGWHEDSPGLWSRGCAAGETGVSYNQNVRDGHTELTLHVDFSTTIPTNELIQRVRNTWLLCHATHPEVAIQVSTGTELPQRMSFETLKSESDAADWLKETFHVVSNQSAGDVTRMTYSRRLPTKGKRTMLYLVTKGAAYPDQPEKHCLVWNISHTLADIYSVVQWFNYVLTTITEIPGDRDLTVSELDYSSPGLYDRLPVTPMTPYEDQYKPTAEQKQTAIDGAVAQGELYAQKMSQSISMTPSPSAPLRPHGTHCIRLQYTLSESQSLLSALQSERLSITFAAAAAVLLAVKQTYGKGHEKGALLGMTRNARRWVSTELKEEGGYRVPCASDTVFLWIPFQEAWFSPASSTRDTILSLGRAIRSALGPHLTGPHYLAALSFQAERFVEGLKKEGEPVPAPQAPGFSPQGALPLQKYFKSSDGRAAIEAHDWVHTGRQINPSAWVGMFSLWERVTLSMGFDVKYYEPQQMEGFMGAVKRNLGSVVTRGDREGVAAKL